MRAEYRLYACLFLAIAAVSGGCGGDDAALRIGLLTECRGGFGGYEELMLAGAELPLLRRGGTLQDGRPEAGVDGARVAGRQVELVRGCTETGEHTILIEEARRLVELEKVEVLVGPMGLGDSLVLREVAQRYPDVIFVPAWAGPQELTLRGPAANVFRFENDLAQDVAGLGAYAFRDLGWRRAAVVADDTGLGWHEEAAFVAEFCALGGEIVQRSHSALEFLGSGDARRPQRLAAADGVAVLMSAQSRPSDLLAGLARRFDAPERHIVVGTYVVEDPSVLSPVRRELEGVIGASSSPPPNSTPAMRRHRRAFESFFTGLPREFAEGPIVLAFHDSMEGLLQALEATNGDARPERLRAALQDLALDLPAGRARLDRNRQAVRPSYLKRIGVTDDGRPTLDLVRVVPAVEQTFGGLLSGAPPPGPGSQPCRKAIPPRWAR